MDKELNELTMYKRGIYKEGAIFEKPSLSGISIPEGFDVPITEAETQVPNEASVMSTALDKAQVFLTAGINQIREENKQIKIDLATSEGPIRSFFWESEKNLEELKKELDGVSVVDVSGKWNEFPANSGKFSIHISSIEKSDTGLEEFLPYIKESRKELVKELFYYIELMSEEKQEFTKKILKDVWEEFIFIPAARGMHHHQYGGLLQHTVENLRIVNAFIKTETLEDVMDLTEKIDRYTRRGLFLEKKAFLNSSESKGNFFCKFNDTEGHHFNMYLGIAKSLKEREEFFIDKDVVIFSTIFHDIGKIMEYSYAGGNNKRYEHFFPAFTFEEGNKTIGPDMDIHGSRLGHITLGIIFLTRKFSEEKMTDGDFLLNVLSAVSSHHGKNEWGSPTVPKSPEDYIVHIADLIGSSFASEKFYN